MPNSKVNLALHIDINLNPFTNCRKASFPPPDLTSTCQHKNLPDSKTKRDVFQISVVFIEQDSRHWIGDGVQEKVREKLTQINGIKASHAKSISASPK